MLIVQIDQFGNQATTVKHSRNRMKQNVSLFIFFFGWIMYISCCKAPL